MTDRTTREIAEEIVTLHCGGNSRWHTLIRIAAALDAERAVAEIALRAADEWAIKHGEQRAALEQAQAELASARAAFHSQCALREKAEARVAKLEKQIAFCDGCNLCAAYRELEVTP